MIVAFLCIIVITYYFPIVKLLLYCMD